MRADREPGVEVACPLCGDGRAAFYADHTRVEQRLFRCRDCGFYFAHPQVSSIPGVTGESEAGEPFEFWAGPEAHAAWNLWRAAENRRVADQVARTGRLERILEIGFGEGPLTELMVARVGEYWGIEPVPVCVERTVPRLDLDPARALCLRAEDLNRAAPFRNMDGYFECIVLVSVFEHLPGPAHILATCQRLLAPGGRLLISSPDSTYFPWLRRMRLLFRMEPWTDQHIGFFSEANLEAAFARSGFEIRAKHDHPLITPLSIRYFRHLTGSVLVKWAMQALSASRIDRLLRIQTFFYVLEKPVGPGS